MSESLQPCISMNGGFVQTFPIGLPERTKTRRPVRPSFGKLFKNSIQGRSGDVLSILRDFRGAPGHNLHQVRKLRHLSGGSRAKSRSSVGPNPQTPEQGRGARMGRKSITLLDTVSFDCPRKSQGNNPRTKTQTISYFVSCGCRR